MRSSIRDRVVARKRAKMEIQTQSCWIFFGGWILLSAMAPLLILVDLGKPGIQAWGAFLCAMGGQFCLAALLIGLIRRGS